MQLDPTSTALINAGTVGAAGSNPTPVNLSPSLNGGDATATTLAVASDVYALTSSLDLTPAVTGGAGGDGTGGTLSGYNPKAVMGTLGTTITYTTPSAPYGYDGGLAGLGGDAELDLTNDQFGSTASPLAADITINDQVEGGAGGWGGDGADGGDGGDSGTYASGGVIYEEAIPGAGGAAGAGPAGGTGGSAVNATTGLTEDTNAQAYIGMTATGGAGGLAGYGGAGGMGSPSGGGGDGGTSGSAEAILTGDTLSAPQVTLSLTATPGMPGYAGMDGDDVYNYEQNYFDPADIINGPLGASGTGKITMTGNTVTVSQLLSPTLHVESDITGTPTLEALNGAAGGNLVFSGNSFIGDGTSELDLQGSGSDATVDDSAGTISIAGSPGNSMTGFNDFVLGDGDTFHAGISPYTTIYVAPDPDTIVLTPGHGAIELFDANSANTILDFQGYGSTFDSLAQLEADTTTDTFGDTVISLPGDGAVTLKFTFGAWTPSVANTNLEDTTGIFSDQTSAAGSYLWSNAANWSNGVPGDDADVIVNGNGTDDIAALVLPFMTLNATVDVAGTSLTVQDLTLAASAQLTVENGSTVTVSGTISGTGGILGADGAGAVLEGPATTDPGETYQVANGGEVILAAMISYQSTLSYDPIGTPGTFALSNPSNYYGSTLGNVAPGDVLEVSESVRKLSIGIAQLSQH